MDEVLASGRVESRYRAALAWQVALAVYVQLIIWVPLGRWNYQPCCSTGLEQLQRGTLSVGDALSIFVYVLPAMVFWQGARRNSRWAMGCSLLALAAWLAIQLWTWWAPYLFGASERWAAVYARAFAESTPILPRWGNHLPPDAAHFVLQVLLGGGVISGALALRRR